MSNFFTLVSLSTQADPTSLTSIRLWTVPGRFHITAPYTPRLQAVSLTANSVCHKELFWPLITFAFIFLTDAFTNQIEALRLKKTQILRHCTQIFKNCDGTKYISSTKPPKYNLRDYYHTLQVSEDWGQRGKLPSIVSILTNSPFL